MYPLFHLRCTGTSYNTKSPDLQGITIPRTQDFSYFFHPLIPYFHIDKLIFPIYDIVRVLTVRSRTFPFSEKRYV